jgi:hypothetical protein
MAMRKFFALINYLNIYLLSLVPLVVALIVLFVGSHLSSKFDGPSHELAVGIVTILGAFSASLTGFAQIYRREAPGIYPDFPITGWLAVVIGSIWVAMCWGVAIYLVFDMIMH